MAERFYINCALAPGEVVIEGPEAHHLATVMRLRPGDPVCLFNGDGREYAAVIQSGSRSQVIVEVTGHEKPARELPWTVEVAAPLPKGDRAQFLLEKLTELGVTRYVPLQTRRSVVHPGDAKREKLQRYVIEASKQCGRNVLMEVQALVAWEEYCRRADLPTIRIVAHPRQDARAAKVVPGDAALAVGPEGGFTIEEIDVALDAGWQVADLGPRILRIETAALVMAVWASGGNDDRAK